MYARPKLTLAAGAAMLVATFTLALWPARNAAQAATANVTVADFDFTDTTSGTLTTTITAGDSVLWTWSGGDTHSVTADDNSFDDPAASFKASGTFSHQFTTPGTYAYYCRVHGAPGGLGMHGIVVVNAAAPTATATNTPVATPTSPAPTRTPTNTPVASTTATAAPPTSTATAAVAPAGTPTPGPAVIAAPDVTTPTGAVAALPSTGVATPARRVAPMWLVVVLALGGGAAVGASALTRRRG
jgi:plastocyanin